MDVIFSPNNFSESTKKIYDYLYAEIINNQLPPGSAISELEIAKQFDCSRSPVREATMALESEGLVRRYPGRGCFVSEITTQDIREIFDLRILLETAALRWSFARLDRRALEELNSSLRALTDKSEPEAYYETDRRLHDLIISSCGNVRLMLILRTLNGQTEQFRRISASRPRRLRESREEHSKLVEAMLDGNLELSCTLLEEHIRNVQSSTESACMQMGTIAAYY